MIEDKTGGSAFPCIRTTSFMGTPQQESFEGMTLRDYFAAKAMQGILASPVAFTLRGEPITYGESQIAELAYQYADAMLKQRNKSSI